mmetsp:Transcript_50163/g.76314  ORF Transcript_50163/g.76314 Transcript_50163/m.76314 type:complete len:206 (-) Transcript_50163:1149-1766(-)
MFGGSASEVRGIVWCIFLMNILLDYDSSAAASSAAAGGFCPQEDTSTADDAPFPRGTNSSLDRVNLPPLGAGAAGALVPCRSLAAFFSFFLRMSFAVGTEPRGCCLYHSFFSRSSLTEPSTMSKLVGGFKPRRPNCSNESTLSVNGPAASFFGARWRFFLPLPFPKYSSSSFFLTGLKPANGSSLTAMTSSFLAATFASPPVLLR